MARNSMSRPRARRTKFACIISRRMASTPRTRPAFRRLRFHGVEAGIASHVEDALPGEIEGQTVPDDVPGLAGMVGRLTRDAFGLREHPRRELDAVNHGSSRWIPSRSSSDPRYPFRKTAPRAKANSALDDIAWHLTAGVRALVDGTHVSRRLRGVFAFHGPRLYPRRLGSFATKSISGFGSSPSSSAWSLRRMAVLATSAPGERTGCGGKRSGSRSTSGRSRTGSALPRIRRP